MAKLKVDSKIDKPKTGTYIEPCQCNNQYQDNVYGKGSRAHNRKKEGGVCTVCGRVKNEPR